MPQLTAHRIIVCAACLFAAVAISPSVCRADEPVIGVPSAGNESPSITALSTGNSIQIPGGNASLVWQAIVDAVDDTYPIERNTPPRIVDGLSQPARLQSFAMMLPAAQAIAATAQRRWVGISMQPAGRGYTVEVSAFVEAQDTLRGVDPEAAAWRTLGHDVAEEQRLAGQIAARLGTAARVFDSEPLWSEPPSAESRSAGWLDRWPRVHQTGSNIVSDYVNYYSVPSLVGQGVAFGIGAAIANTQADQALLSAYQHGIGYSSGIHGFKVFGEGTYTFPAFAAIGLVGLAFDQTACGSVMAEYGARGLRAGIVGGPALLLMQRVTGASRPGENYWGSNWKFFVDNNGVSGHAFVGAIPFITAAKMTDRPVLKVAFYGLSVMPGLSRVNDGQHYPSQVFLGYTMAWFACTAVDNTQTGRSQPLLIPWAVGNASGLGFEWRR